MLSQSVGDNLAAAVIDLGLPDRPGDELVADIRALRPDVPIILATGYASEDIAGGLRKMHSYRSYQKLLIRRLPWPP